MYKVGLSTFLTRHSEKKNSIIRASAGTGNLSWNQFEICYVHSPFCGSGRPKHLHKVSRSSSICDWNNAISFLSRVNLKQGELVVKHFFKNFKDILCGWWFPTSVWFFLRIDIYCLLKHSVLQRNKKLQCIYTLLWALRKEANIGKLISVCTY